MEQEFELIAKTFMGLEPVLAKELTLLGANNIQIGRRMVSFTGNKEMMYRANFQLHTAIKILKPIKRFKARSADDVYEAVKQIDWAGYFSGSQTFAVDAVVFSEEFRHSKFVSYKVKDAIVDQFRERTGSRPNVSVTNPELRLHIHIAEDDCTLCLDSSGESLHQRGYRQESVKAPLNEVLAAGIIMLTGWNGEIDFIDPFCGSGTLLIEAALLARNIAPGMFRKGYAFEKWSDFDADLFDRIYNECEAAEKEELTCHLYGYDIDPKAVGTARRNVSAAGLSDLISIDIQDFKDFQQPSAPAIIVTNPPYGERITTPDLLETYRMIGERFKKAFTGNDAWVLSYREECFEKIGLKPSIKIPLFNGSLECELRKYQMFSGRITDFNREGGQVKTDEERSFMGEKHRFKKEREFKQRLTEQDDNEDGDIRSFTFHKHEIGGFSSERASQRDDDRKHFDRRKRDDDDRRSFDRRKRDDDDRKPFDRRKRDDGKPFDRRERRDKANSRFDGSRTYQSTPNSGGHERFDRSRGGRKGPRGGNK